MRLTDTVQEQQHGQYVVDHNPDSQGPQHVLVYFPEHCEQLSQCKRSAVSARPQVIKKFAGN